MENGGRCVCFEIRLQGAISVGKPNGSYEETRLREKSYRNVVADFVAATVIFALLLCLVALGDVAMWLIAHDLAPRERTL